MDAFIPTNTLASVNFDVLKMDAVEDPLINVNKLATMDFEESYFSSAVNFINECNNEITDKKIRFYKSLSEATNEVLVLESFSDYFSGVKDVLTKFFKFLKSLVERFFIALNKFVKSDNYLTKHLKELDGFKSEDNFSFYGYNYTFTPNIPAPQAALSFNASLFSDIVPKTGGELNASDVKDITRSLDLESQCDAFRAQVLGKDSGSKIFYTEFQDELFAVYRDGELNTVNIDVDNSFVMNSARRYKEYDKTKKDVEKQRSEIEKAYTQVQKEVQNVVRANGNLNVNAFLNNLPSGVGITSINSNNTDSSGAMMSGDMMVTIDTYVKAKVDQIQEYSNIHLLAFSAKLDAIKECYVQDRNVLYTALSRVTKSGNARKEEKRK